MKNLIENKLLKVLTLNSISVIVSFFLGILSTKLIAIYMGVAGMALLGSFRNFASMFKSIATLGISTSVVKLIVENKENKEEISKIYSTFFWIFLCISLFLTSFILIFSDNISFFLFTTSDFVIPIQFFALFLPFVILNVFWIAIYNGLEEFKKIIYIQIISNILIFLLTAFLVWKKNSFGGLLAIAISEMFFVIVTFLFIRKDSKYFRFNLQRLVCEKYYKTLFKFSSMALLSAVIVPFTLIIIRKIIIAYSSLEEAGMWDAVNKLSSFYMMIISSGLSLYYMPKLASLKSESEFKRELKMYFKFFVPLFLLMIIAVFILKDMLIKIAFTTQFYKIKNVLIWQLLGDLFKIMTLSFGYQILVKTMVKKYFFMEIFFNLMYLGFSFFLVKIFSFEGALQAYLYSNMILFVSVLFMFRKLLHKSI